MIYKNEIIKAALPYFTDPNLRRAIGHIANFDTIKPGYQSASVQFIERNIANLFPDESGQRKKTMLILEGVSYAGKTVAAIYGGIIYTLMALDRSGYLKDRFARRMVKREGMLNEPDIDEETRLKWESMPTEYGSEYELKRYFEQGRDLIPEFLFIPSYAFKQAHQASSQIPNSDEIKSAVYRDMLLIIDDLGREGDLSNHADSVYDALFDRPFPTIITTNDWIENIKLRHGIRNFNRIKEQGIWFDAGKTPIAIQARG